MHELSKTRRSRHLLETTSCSLSRQWGSNKYAWILRLIDGEGHHREGERNICLCLRRQNWPTERDKDRQRKRRHQFLMKIKTHHPPLLWGGKLGHIDV